MSAAQFMNTQRMAPDLGRGLAAGRAFVPSYTALYEVRTDLPQSTVLQPDEAEVPAQRLAARASVELPAAFLLTRPDVTIVADAAAVGRIEPSDRMVHA